MRISSMGSATSSVSYTFINNAIYDAAYDIWLDPTAKTDGVNQTEIMIWFNHVGSIQPVGSQTGTGTVGGRSWAIWTGNNGQNNVISFVAPSAISSWNFSVLDFLNAAISRGLATSAWFLTSIQAGFEPWQGGVGLAVTSFSATVNGGGGGGDTSPPSAPTNLTTSGLTSSSVNLSWSASTDNTGVTGYDVFRAQGGGSFSQIGTATGTSFSATGLSASTSYSFRVRARDAAGNTSGDSNTVTVTTPSGGGGGGGGACRVTYTPNSWATGFTADITIANTSSTAVNGWALTFTLPSGQTITNAWNATVTPSSGAVTARNLNYNATIAANGGTQAFGFQATLSGTFSRPSAFSLNGTACTIG
jgi:hypothetical protein